MKVFREEVINRWGPRETEHWVCIVEVISDLDKMMKVFEAPLTDTRDVFPDSPLSQRERAIPNLDPGLLM